MDEKIMQIKDLILSITSEDQVLWEIFDLCPTRQLLDLFVEISESEQDEDMADDLDTIKELGGFKSKFIAEYKNPLDTTTLYRVYEIEGIGLIRFEQYTTSYGDTFNEPGFDTVEPYQITFTEYLKPKEVRLEHKKIEDNGK